MFVLVTYDVSTKTPVGRRRLTHVAKTCKDFGLRAQNSVFECNVNPAQFATLKHRLLRIIEPEEDSLRFYFLGSNWQHRVEHHGAKPTLDLDGPLLI